jgi:glycerophosphoryl diester phosphodiesterase
MLVIGHRGASGHALENTLDAFERCVAPSPTACDGVELDIHATADGELVVHHDPALADGRSIHDLTAAELAAVRLRDGSAIPTLAEALAVLTPIEVFIEAKGVSIHGLGRLRALMAGHPFPERLHVHAFDHRVIRRLFEADAALSLGVLSSSYPMEPVAPVLAAGARTLWQEWQLIDRELVERCRHEGVRVIAWTVNDARTAAHLGGLGVAGVCGNWPERLVVGRKS